MSSELSRGTQLDLVAKLAMGMEIEGVGDTDELGTVWVVTYRTDDDVHSQVAGVYATEQSAREHKRNLANNATEHGAIAWGVHEQTLSAGLDGGV